MCSCQYRLVKNHIADQENIQSTPKLSITKTCPRTKPHSAAVSADASANTQGARWPQQTHAGAWQPRCRRRWITTAAVVARTVIAAAIVATSCDFHWIGELGLGILVSSAGFLARPIMNAISLAESHFAG